VKDVKNVMDDREIEARLRRVRPQGPPAALRRRVVAAAARKPAPRGEWLLPLTAAAAAFVLYALADQARASAVGGPLMTNPTDDAIVRTVTEQLGGGPLAQYVASRIQFVEPAEEFRVE
jgi:hypothetical protein